MIKSIKRATAKRYTTKQLYKHLDRVLTKLDKSDFRIDYQYGKVYIWNKRQGRYQLWSCMNDYDHSVAMKAIVSVYDQNDIDHDFTYDVL